MFIGVLFWLSQVTSQVADESITKTLSSIIDSLPKDLEEEKYREEMAKGLISRIPREEIVSFLINTVLR